MAQPLQPPGPHLIPVRFQGQIVPGVQAEVHVPPGLQRWSYTINHVLERVPQIRQTIFALPGLQLQPGESIRPINNQNLGLGFDDYEIYQLPGVAPPALQIPPFNPAAAGWPGFGLGAGAGPAAALNPYAGIQIGPARIVPDDAVNAILGENFNIGEEMANFHGESGHGRYYKKSTFNSLERKGAAHLKENPFTRAPIQVGDVQFYTKQGGKLRRRGTHRRKRQHRKRKTRTSRR